MKVLPFTIPVSHDKTVIVQEDILPYFYTHLHRHEEIQLAWVQKGEGTLVVGNNMHAFGPNEIYLIGPNMPHVFKSDPSYFLPKSKKKVHKLDIFFNPKGKLDCLFYLPEMKAVQALLKQFQDGFKIPQEFFADISSRLLNIKQTSGLEQLIQFMQLLKLLSNLTDLKSLTNNVQIQSVSDFEGVRIGSIYNHVMQHYDKDLTLEEVASVAHMTPQAFCRYFKKHTRLTFIAFLNEVRINEACKKLVDGNYNSISAVAYNCGFNSITNFNRVFKTSVGKSPREYVDDFAVSTN